MKELLISTRKEQLLETLENSRNYTIAVAYAMPGEHYDFKPVETVWSFKDLIHHIAYSIQWWQDNYIKGEKTDWAPPAAGNNKEEVISYLDNMYDNLKDTIAKKNISDETIKGFHATLDHITHHRGQAVLQLRLKGVVPPEYTY
jgi:uncharacterized damage-inducible protein DinB